MSATVPPCDILGVAPGAGPGEIDSAYRRLIKQYHPDQPGGDGARAAEINQAYTMLKGSAARVRLDGGAAGAPLLAAEHCATWLVDDQWPTGKPRRGARLGLLGLSAIAMVLAWVASDVRAGSWLDQHWQRLQVNFARMVAMEPGTRLAGSRGNAPAPAASAVEAIPPARRDAAGIIGQSGVFGAAEASRSCYRAYNRSLSLALLEHCLAFDQAAAAILQAEDDEPTRYFEPLAITARQLAAAQLLTRS